MEDLPHIGYPHIAGPDFDLIFGLKFEITFQNRHRHAVVKKRTYLKEMWVKCGKSMDAESADSCF